MMTLANLVDTVLLCITLTCFFDQLRIVNAKQAPLRAVTFALIAVGTFGCVGYNFQEPETFHHWWVYCLHAGFASYSIQAFAVHYPYLGERRGQRNPRLNQHIR